MDWDKVSTELRKPLDPKHVKPAPRGKHGDYVDAYHVISEANRIFGEGGWSYEVTRLEKVSEQVVQAQKGEQLRVGYLATVRVTVGDTIREGAAVGSGVGHPDNAADHHESAVKEAETDALKRALRSYGNTFGHALYDKEKTNVREAPPERDPGAIRDSLLDAVKKRNNWPEFSKLTESAKFTAPLEWLAENDRPKANQVTHAIEEKRRALDPAMQAPPVYDQIPYEGAA